MRNIEDGGKKILLILKTLIKVIKNIKEKGIEEMLTVVIRLAKTLPFRCNRNQNNDLVPVLEKNSCRITNPRFSCLTL